MIEAREVGFGTYINIHRKAQKVTLEQLSEGLCSSSEMGRIEKGESLPDKLLQDRLLSRLGISPDDYENFLDSGDYRRWKMRQQLLQIIMEGKTGQAWERLSQYSQEYDMGDRLERQFVLAMEIQIRKQERAVRGELAELCRQAVELTVPEAETRSVADRLLSVQELNLVLECERQAGRDGLAGRYEEILCYIEQRKMDPVSLAKIHPKVVYCMWEEWNDREHPGMTEDDMLSRHGSLLRLCQRGIEILRDSGRMYYLWELLCMHQELLERIAEGLTKGGGLWEKFPVWPAIRMKEEWKEAEEWKGALEEICEEYRVPKETYEDCYLYVEKEVYCISDVVRNRRRMMGMTASELCEGVCSEKTLHRLERNERKTQQPVVRGLFRKLGLAAEYYRTELVTASVEAKSLMKELRKSVNRRDGQAINRLVDRLESIVSLEEPVNRQVLEDCRLKGRWHMGGCSTEEYNERLVEILEMTLPLEAIFCEGEKYMTNKELECIMGLGGEWEKEQAGKGEPCRKVLREFYGRYEEEGILCAFINMYELTMTSVANDMGNREEYEQSDAISRRIIKEELLSRRIGWIYSNIYNILWNYDEQEKRNIPLREKRNTEKDLLHCIAFAKFEKDKREVDFLEKKLKMRNEKC
ncbi:MAG: helix-turn-helix transcriptional regulator [Lachnospiraceae bacterium]|nr:helix-turn-helix transcriptional regulator [Lachnospiraceae bacterium]